MQSASTTSSTSFPRPAGTPFLNALRAVSGSISTRCDGCTLRAVYLPRTCCLRPRRTWAQSCSTAPRWTTSSRAFRATCVDRYSSGLRPNLRPMSAGPRSSGHRLPLANWILASQTPRRCSALTSRFSRCSMPYPGRCVPTSRADSLRPSKSSGSTTLSTQPSTQSSWIGPRQPSGMLQLPAICTGYNDPARPGPRRRRGGRRRRASGHSSTPLTAVV